MIYVRLFLGTIFTQLVKKQDLISSLFSFTLTSYIHVFQHSRCWMFERFWLIFVFNHFSNQIWYFCVFWSKYVNTVAQSEHVHSDHVAEVVKGKSVIGILVNILFNLFQLNVIVKNQIISPKKQNWQKLMMSLQTCMSEVLISSYKYEPLEPRIYKGDVLT